ncbi:hypothetical protein PspLS_07110 [Pyricularia sp. CBS 133598]|nr:hypothetical protein PspLS_07110 [Pyricularia sp. CBS 133598]
MHPTTILIIATGFFETAEAFRCQAGQYGLCSFHKSSDAMVCCGIVCKDKGAYVDCTCPSHYAQ